jgi:hypothetical protein
MAERNVTVDKVEREHLAEVNAMAQAGYLVAVIAGSTILMLALIAWLGAASS